MSFGQRLVRGGHSSPAFNGKNMDCFHCWWQVEVQIHSLKTVMCKPMGDINIF